MRPAAELAERLGLPVTDFDLLEQALVHSSWLHEHRDAARGHNERLEFLGDVVINQLYRLTDLQTSFGVINLAIVRGRPAVLDLKETLAVFAPLLALPAPTSSSARDDGGTPWPACRLCL